MTNLQQAFELSESSLYQGGEANDK